MSSKSIIRDCAIYLYHYSDPIQTLFLESIRSQGYGGLDNASPAIKAQLDNELMRLAKQVLLTIFIPQRTLESCLYEVCEAAPAAYIKSDVRTYRSIELLRSLPRSAGKH